MLCTFTDVFISREVGLFPLKGLGNIPAVADEFFSVQLFLLFERFPYIHGCFCIFLLIPVFSWWSYVTVLSDHCYTTPLDGVTIVVVREHSPLFWYGKIREICTQILGCFLQYTHLGISVIFYSSMLRFVNRSYLNHFVISVSCHLF